MQIDPNLQHCFEVFAEANPPAPSGENADTISTLEVLEAIREHYSDEVSKADVFYMLTEFGYKSGMVGREFVWYITEA